MSKHPEPVVTAEELEDYIVREFSQAFRDGKVYHIEDLGPGFLTLRLDTNDTHLRPGGTVSGPTLFTLADLAAYYAIMAHIGLKGLSVTTSIHLDFMRKAAPGPLYATCTLLKLGKRLVVTSVAIKDKEDDLIAQGSLTYSIPPRD